MTEDELVATAELIKAQIIEEWLQGVDAIKLLQIAAHKEGWVMAVENTDGDDTEIMGLIIGEEDWIEDHTLDMESFDIWHTGGEGEAEHEELN